MSRKLLELSAASYFEIREKLEEAGLDDDCLWLDEDDVEFIRADRLDLCLAIEPDHHRQQSRRRR